MDAVDATHDVPATAEHARGLEFLLASLAAATVMADFCLWRDNPRLSVGLLAVGIAGIILLNRPGLRWTRSAVVTAGLLCGAAAESAIDLCFSNVLVLLALILALAGETFYRPLRSGWRRWSEMLWTMVKTPGRWIWLLIEIGKQTREMEPVTPGGMRRAARALWIVLPGLVVTLGFAAILSNGNALFAKLTGDWAASVWAWVLGLDLSFWRCSFWAFATWLALPLLRPSPAPKEERLWSKEVPALPEVTTTRTARLQSVVILGLLNALFCCVNTIDAVYLWARQALPAGVTYKEFVHQGASSLIIAALFSAVLLGGMFQQARNVSGWRPLRLLGLLWIAQNLVLLAGVSLRVKLYVDAFNLTVTRVNLMFFIALVAVGFLLLAIHVWRQCRLGWLLHSNMLAAFFLFYAVQFLDTEGFVARYNLKLWKDSNETRALDLPYLESLGPPAFGAIQGAAQFPAMKDGIDAALFLKTAQDKAREQLDHTPWASWQLRARHYQRNLLMTTEP